MADFFRWIIEKLVVWKSKSVVNLVEMRNISLVSLLFKFLWRFFPVQNSNDKENRKKSLENVWKTDCFLFLRLLKIKTFLVNLFECFNGFLAIEFVHFPLQQHNRRKLIVFSPIWITTKRKIIINQKIKIKQQKMSEKITRWRDHPRPQTEAKKNIYKSF